MIGLIAIDSVIEYCITLTGYDATPEEVRDSCEYFKRNVAEHDKHSMTASTML